MHILRSVKWQQAVEEYCGANFNVCEIHVTLKFSLYGHLLIATENYHQ